MRRKSVRRGRVERWEGGFALLALIVALVLIAIALTAILPDAKTQGQRQREIEMMYRGDQMAEAIARYYSGGKFAPAGLVVKTPPPAYGYLTELKKLRDGVTIGNDQVYFVRASAFIDPLTNGDWEPIRIGDPRLRKFFRAWQQFTGRQLPPIYASYLGAGSVLDTSERPADGAVPEGQSPNDPAVDGSEDEEFDDEDDEDDEEDDEDDSGDEDDSDDEDDSGDGASLRAPGHGSGAALFVNAAYQVGPSAGVANSNSNSNANTNTTRGGFRDPHFAFGNGSTQRNGPIIGVVSKKKGSSVVARYGIEHYEDMIFIYFPPQLPGQVQQAPGNPSGQGTGGTDANGDGIPDDATPNKPPGQQ